MSEYIEVQTAIDSREGAEKIAHTLVSNRLAACVQISGPITSTYWWHDKMEIAEEWICLAKTRQDLFHAVEQTIKENHPYDLPEITSRALLTGSEEYMNWILNETQ